MNQRKGITMHEPDLSDDRHVVSGEVIMKGGKKKKKREMDKASWPVHYHFDADDLTVADRSGLVNGER